MWQVMRSIPAQEDEGDRSKCTLTVMYDGHVTEVNVENGTTAVSFLFRL